jgi:hypothetical protein
MSTTWYSLNFSAIPPNNYSVSYYFSVASGLVTGIYRYDDLSNNNILAPKTLFGGNSGSDNVFTVGTLQFSITAGTNFYDPSLCSSILSGYPTATNYFNLYSVTSVNAKAGIYYWNNTGTSGDYLITRATVTAYPSPNIVSIGSQPVITASNYNINNSNLLYNYQFDTNYLDYKTGLGVSNATTTNVSISTANTKLTSGSILFPGSTGTIQNVQLPSTTLTTTGLTIAFWAKIIVQNVANPQFIFSFSTGTTANIIGLSFNSAGALTLMLYKSSVGSSYSLNYAIPDAGWHHYCITAVTAGTWNTYMDGVQMTAPSISLYPTLSAMTSSYIGANILSYPNINGNMNQFVFFNRVITSTELSYLVNYPAQVGFSSSVTTVPVVSTQPYPCFLEGSKILCLNPETDEEEYLPVETLREGDLVKTSNSGYKAIFHIGWKTIPNPADDPEPRNRLYRFQKSQIPWMTEDLCITGEHCTLHRKLSPAFEETVRKHMGDIYITEYQYRVPACIDKRATAYEGEGSATIWHFALENHNIYHNYGVYANGLLVESCSIEHLVNRSKMMLV